MTSASVTGGISTATGDRAGVAIAIGVGCAFSSGSPCPTSHAVSGADSVTKTTKSNGVIVNPAFIGSLFRN